MEKDDATIDDILNSEDRDRSIKEIEDKMSSTLARTVSNCTPCATKESILRWPFRPDMVNDGYLTISAEKGLDKDEKDKNDKYIRRERYAGSMSRSFYVGENMKEEDIHAKYENGILTLDVPKEQKKAVPEKRYIAIEG